MKSAYEYCFNDYISIILRILIKFVIIQGYYIYILYYFGYSRASKSQDSNN